MTIEERFWSKVDKRGPDECWEWKASLDAYGYGQLFRCVGKRPYRAHRLSLELSGVSVPSDALVCHKCNSRRCVNPAHLYIGSYAENNRDTRRNGKHVSGFSFIRGSKHHNSKLSEQQVAEIRRRHNGNNTRALAREFNVDRTNIQLIINHKTWRHI